MCLAPPGLGGSLRCLQDLPSPPIQFLLPMKDARAQVLGFVSSSVSPWRRQWHPTPVLLPGKSHGRRSLVGYSPCGRKESDMTERLHFRFSLSCIGEGNSNPLQCSCLENSRDGGAWWAAIYGVAQSWTQLKRLSSSSSSCVPLAHPESCLPFSTNIGIDE